MDPMLAWGLGLFGLSFLLVLLELVIPSAGIIGGVALVVAIAGDVCLFIGGGPGWGILGIVLIVVSIPGAIWLGTTMLTSTVFGREIMFGAGGEDVAAAVPSAATELARLDGKTGEALTDLRPVGVARIDGERFDVLAENDMIEAGTAVRVVGISGLQVKVRPVDR